MCVCVCACECVRGGVGCEDTGGGAENVCVFSSPVSCQVVSKKPALKNITCEPEVPSVRRFVFRGTFTH